MHHHHRILFFTDACDVRLFTGPWDKIFTDLF